MYQELSFAKTCPPFQKDKWTLQLNNSMEKQLTNFSYVPKRNHNPCNLRTIRFLIVGLGLFVL